jgi:hypothetical protein
MRLWAGFAIGLVLGAGGTAGARGTCVIEGKSVPAMVVDVAPREATPFRLRVEGLPVQVEPGGLETPATVRVKGALAFEARLSATEIPARTRRAVEDLSGMVRLAPATEKLTLHANVRARLVDADVRIGGVELHGLVLPCDALTLDDVTPPKPSLEDDGSPRFVATGKRLHLRGQPGKGPSLEVALDDPDALELKRVEEQGGWMRVTSRWPDGTMLHGWVKRDELAAAGAHHERIGELSPVGAAGCVEAPRAAMAHERVVAAPVAPGTQVFAARYLGAWAKVVDGGKLQVRFRPKDDWVEIVGAPGIASATGCATSTALNDAWVPRAAAKLPAERAQPPSQ